MEIVSYNINGLRASTKSGLIDWLVSQNADIYCFQEARCDKETASKILFGEKVQLDLFSCGCESKLKEYFCVYNCGEVPGYAGTITLTKQKPDKVFYDMGEFWRDKEGRTTTIVLKDVAVINAYIPNGNSRLEFKIKYLEALKSYIAYLRKSYKVICVGDFNIAHNEIDLTNPKQCENKSVFLPIERNIFSDILKVGLVDAFRYLYPSKVEYTWRSYRSLQDTSYVGWKYRIDYILVDDDLKLDISESQILNLIYSDHLPVVVELNKKENIYENLFNK